MPNGVLALEARLKLGCRVRGEANLLPLEDESEAAGPLLEVGDHRLPPF